MVGGELLAWFLSRVGNTQKIMHRGWGQALGEKILGIGPRMKGSMTIEKPPICTEKENGKHHETKK
jgi:hypothetical protein